MTGLKHSKKTALAVLCFSILYSSAAGALIPVADAPSALNSAKEWFNGIKESKFVVDTTKTITNVSSAVGDIKSSVSEYVTKNLKAAQEEMKKIQEYKKQVEEYKKEYEEYRKMLDENIAKAKELQAAASGLGAVYKDKLGVGSSDSDDDTSDGTDENDTAESNGTSGGATTPSATQPSTSSGADTGSSSNNWNDYEPETTPSSNRTAFGQPQEPEVVQKLDASSPSTVKEAEQYVLSSAEKEQLPKIEAKIAAGIALNPEEQAIYEKAQARKAIINSPKLTAEEQAALPAIREKLAAGEALTPEEQAIYDKAAQRALAEAVMEAEGISEADEITEEDEALAEELTKMSDEEWMAKLKSMDEEKLAKLAKIAEEHKKAAEEMLAMLKEADASKLEELKAIIAEHQAAADKMSAMLEAADEAKKTELGKTAANNESKDKESAERLKSADEAKRSTFEAPAAGKSPRRRTFQRQSRLSAGTYHASVSYEETLGSASIMNMPDGGVDGNKTFIAPKSVAMYCDNKSSSDFLVKGTMDECLVKIRDQINKPRLEQLGNPEATYADGYRAYAAVYIAEAYKAQNDTAEYVKKVIEPIETAPGEEEIDIYGNIVEMNKAVFTTMNGLLKIYGSRLALNAYGRYGRYGFSSPQEEEEE